jgi:hypothetical protein
MNFIIKIKKKSYTRELFGQVLNRFRDRIAFRDWPEVPLSDGREHDDELPVSKKEGK